MNSTPGPEPEPSGERVTPPPGVLIALGEADWMGGIVIIDLLDSDESQAFVDWFEKRGAKVFSTEGMLDYYLTALEETRLIVTDNPALPRTLEADPAPSVCVVVERTQTAVEGAFSSGANFVLPRPINRAHPLDVQI